MKDELVENRKVSRQVFEELAKPLSAEQIFTPVAESVIKGYDEVYNLFSKPIERDYLPPKYYELKTDEERAAFLAHLKAYEAARFPVCDDPILFSYLSSQPRKFIDSFLAWSQTWF
jgi:hypothetical protein